MARPLKFKTPEEMESKIEEYFKHCDKFDKPITIGGLSRHLGMYRDALLRYGKNELFYDIIKKARERVEEYYEEKLSDKNSSTAGVIFILKNNFGWTDKAKEEAFAEGVQNMKLLIESLQNQVK